MSTHRIATREQWRAERLDLLKAEKDLTHRSDELARRRQELPWVKIDKDYRFDTDEGSASLVDLFKGRSQLLVYQFHVRSRLQRRLPVLLGDRRRVRRRRSAPRQPRCDALGHLPRPARQAAGLQAAHGLDLPLGLLLR
jgi:hypothetical protein